VVDEKNVYIVASTIAVLFEVPDTPIGLNQEVMGKLLTPPLTVAQGPTGSLMIASQRQQIDVQVDANKVNVRGLSGNRGSDGTGPVVFKGRPVARVLFDFLQYIHTPVRAYGINFDVAVPVADGAEQWIVNTLLKPTLRDELPVKVPEESPAILRSGQVKLSMEYGPKTLNIEFKAGSDGRIRVDYNAHQDVSILPEEAKLTDEQISQFSQLVNFLNSLGV
jgi:hypothetical protein